MNENDQTDVAPEETPDVPAERDEVDPVDNDRPYPVPDVEDAEVQPC